MPNEKPRIPQPLFAPVVRATGRFLFRIFGGMAVIGAENVPCCGPVMLCPNHISDCDPVAMFAATPRKDIYFVAKQELFEIPILGPAIRAFGAFPIRRESADRAALRQAEEILEQGSALVLFPEGHISETGRMKEVLPGAAMVALRAGAPVIPVGIARTNRVLPYGKVIPRFSPLPTRIVYGKPISMEEFADLKGRKATAALAERIEFEIKRLAGQA